LISRVWDWATNGTVIVDLRGHDLNIRNIPFSKRDLILISDADVKVLPRDDTTKDKLILLSVQLSLLRENDMRRVSVVIWRTAVIVLPYFTIISSPITSFACERFNGSFNVSKLAILIGSSNYENFPLCTVHNDIGSISNQLKTSGYSVDYYENLSLASLTELFNRLDKPLHTFTGDFLLYFLAWME